MMNNNNSQALLDKSAALQIQAYDIIDKIGLMKRWGTIGKPILVGSVRFGLMASPNIDMEIYVDKPEINIGFDIIEKFAAIPGVYQIQYNNFMDNASDPGLYWRIDYRDDQGTNWDIDNWLVPFSHPHAGMAGKFAEAMTKALTTRTKQIILEIKHKNEQGIKAKGIDIYRAVMDGGVTSYDEFLKWLEVNKNDGIIEWQPTFTE